MQTADAQMLVLCTLARGPLHGYAINTAIQELSGERLGREASQAPWRAWRPRT